MEIGSYSDISRKGTVYIGPIFKKKINAQNVKRTKRKRIGILVTEWWNWDYFENEYLSLQRAWYNFADIHFVQYRISWVRELIIRYQYAGVKFFV